MVVGIKVPSSSSSHPRCVVVVGVVDGPPDAGGIVLGLGHLPNSMMVEIAVCCADCGGVAGGGVSLKACKSCMSVKYCNADCQKNHWPKHKAACKQRAAELRDEALFKDPPAKEDCPICFLPMPFKLISCVSLPPGLFSPYQFTTSHRQMWSWQICQRNNIMHAAERVFVEGVCTPSANLGIWIIARTAEQIK